MECPFWRKTEAGFLFMKIRQGENIKVVEDGEGVFIHAPLTNKTTLKLGAFTLQGDVVEVEAGEGIRLKSIHPNKLIISSDTDKQTCRIIELESRVRALEVVIADLLKVKIKAS